MRVVGFDKAKLEQLKPFCDYSLPVTLRDCVVQSNKYTNQLEIVLKTHTKIKQSAVTFEVSDIKTAGKVSPLKLRSS